MAPPATQREIRRVLETVAKEIGWETTAPRDLARAQERAAVMRRAGKLDETAVAGFARAHKYDDVVAALALMCAAPLDVIDQLMSSPRNDGLLVPCRVAKLSWATVDTILQHRGAQHALTGHDREKLRAEYGRLSQATAQRLLGFWQAQATRH
jgi:hypothetical protein